ncbi:redox-regulated molecular chaperone HslO [soil metagenome]
MGERNDTDRLIRGTALEGRVRCFALDATGVVAELQRRHGTFPAVTAALGRTAMGALLLAAAALKEEEQLLTVEVRGDGEAGRILCTANGGGALRGFVANPRADAASLRPGKLNVAGVVGSSGYLSVTKELGLREPYRGTVELQSGEIGEDLAFYLARSEQIPSAVGIGVFVRPDGSAEAAGGYLLQLLGGIAEDEVASLEQRLESLPHPTALIREGTAPEEMLGMIFPEGYELQGQQPVAFRCPCSRERFESAIVSLGSEEVSKIIAEGSDDPIEVICHFCNEVYYYTIDQMEDILRAAS